MGLDLTIEDVTALGERTEGWIAGLQLAALSIQGRSDTADFIRAFTGSHIYIAEYLIEEILQKQPEDIQLFLLQTSILERMNAGLCEAITACQDGQATLMELDRANIFIIPLDSEGHWFRYHHLFADLLLARLRQHLPAGEIAMLQLRAADWYEQNGFIPEAVNHTLAAGDFERAALLVDKAGQMMIFTDQYNTLKSWLDELPAESFDAYPRLEIYRVLIELNLGTMDMYEQTLLEKEKLVKSLPPSPENDRLRLEALVYLSLFMAHQNTYRAIQMAQEVLDEIPESDLKLRAFLFSALYRAYGMDGDIEKSAPAYRECLRLAQAANQYAMISNTTMVRAFDLCQYGRLDEAASYCQVILDAGAQLKRKVFYPAGTAYIGLGGIHLERYELEAAEDYLTRGLELCRQGGTYGLYTGYLQLARLHQAKGELEKALEVLQTLEQTLQRRDFTLTARQVSLRLAVDDVDGASRLIASLLEILGGSHYSQRLPLIAQEAFKLYLARIYIAQEEFGQANQVLDEIQATVEPGQRFGRLMEVYLLRALAGQKQNEGDVTPEAVDHLERALDLAEHDGFVLLLLEEGPALIPLLEAVIERQDTPSRLKQYAQKLLTFAGEGESAAPHLLGEADGLIESLTPREMEVLQLVAAGESNQAIADQLVITVRTVKKHLTNILGKLEASNRTQAVARARELGLLYPD
jgi:LuxR family maltose regulon positive regulatory protein